eukprot:GHVH01004887.1.p1 GENE.GHVH01004887.1~~GHVH01004887.1.p1  ORF type:complete len:792 (+),score=88.16 GHVH01004887.1:24-2378(+)
MSEFSISASSNDTMDRCLSVHRTTMTCVNLKTVNVQNRELISRHAGLLFGVEDNPMNIVFSALRNPKETIPKDTPHKSATPRGRIVENAKFLKRVRSTSSIPSLGLSLSPSQERYVKQKYSKLFVLLGFLMMALLVEAFVILQKNETLSRLTDLALENESLKLSVGGMENSVRQLAMGVPSRVSAGVQLLMPNVNSESMVGQFLEYLDTFDQNTDVPIIPPLDDPALLAKDEDWKPKHPFYLVPGFTTNGLEVWKSRSCADAWFRKRIWGQFSMASSFASHKECWLQHMSLDNDTGLDPSDGISVRATTGLEAIDYFMPIYHVWNPLIAGLGRFGYDSGNMAVGNWDWRLSPALAHTRDKSYLRFTSEIEQLVEVNGATAVIISHSYGDVMVRSWLRWVEVQQLKAKQEGSNGRFHNWINRHLRTYVSVSGPMMGVPKAYGALLSGEFRETAEMSIASRKMAESLVSPAARCKLWRTWSGLVAMLPERHAPWTAPTVVIKQKLEDLSFAAIEGAQYTNKVSELWSDEAYDYIENLSTNDAGKFKRWMGDVGEDSERLNFRYLEDPLTLDPDTKLDFHCYYGVGIETEAGYVVDPVEVQAVAPYEHEDISEDDEINLISSHRIAIEVTGDCYKSKSGACVKINRGIIIDPNGDGSVSHVSNSHMCRNAWQEAILEPEHDGTVAMAPEHGPRLNPHKQKVLVKELREHSHNTDTYIQNVGGAANHVDVLGNWEILKDMILLGSGQLDDNHVKLKHKIESESKFLINHDGEDDDYDYALIDNEYDEL